MPEDKLKSIHDNIFSLFEKNWDILEDIIPALIQKNIRDHEFTNELFEFVQNVRPSKLCNRDKVNPHGAKIIEIYKEKGQLGDFIRMWRRHFIKNNDLPFLPKEWRIDHKIERNFGEKSIYSKS